MRLAILIIHTLVTVTLIGLILLQNSKGGLQSGIGGGEMYRSRRGAERIVFIGTIVFGVLFFITSMVSLFVK